MYVRIFYRSRINVSRFAPFQMLSFYQQFIYLTYSSIFSPSHSKILALSFYCLHRWSKCASCVLKSLLPSFAHTLFILQCSFLFHSSIQFFFFVRPAYILEFTHEVGMRVRLKIEMNIRHDLIWEKRVKQRGKRKRKHFSENAMRNRQIYINIVHCHFGLTYERVTMWIGEYVKCARGTIEIAFVVYVLCVMCIYIFLDVYNMLQFLNGI